MSERLIHAPEDWSNLQQAVRDLQQQLQAQRERAEAAERERDELISRTHQTIIFSCGCRVILDGLDAEPILMFCQTHKGE